MLLDEEGRPVGVADKATVHGAAHPAPPRLLLLRLRRGRPRARHPAGGGEAGVPAGLDRHVLRAPRARGGSTPRCTAGCATSSACTPATSRWSCPTSPTAPRTGRSRRTSCARSTSAGSTATRRRRPTRSPSGCGGTGTRSSRRDRPRQHPVAVGPAAGPAARPPAGHRPARPAPPPHRVTASRASGFGESASRSHGLRHGTRSRPASAPVTTCGTSSASSRTSGAVHEPVASWSRPTSSGPTAQSV